MPGKVPPIEQIGQKHSKGGMKKQDSGDWSDGMGPYGDPNRWHRHRKTLKKDV